MMGVEGGCSIEHVFKKIVFLQREKFVRNCQNPSKSPHLTGTDVWDGVDLASPPIKLNLNICQGTIDDAVGLFKNITNATLIIHENDSTMSCKKTSFCVTYVCTPQTYYYTDLNYEFEVGILS